MSAVFRFHVPSLLGIGRIVGLHVSIAVHLVEVLLGQLVLLGNAVCLRHRGVAPLIVLDRALLCMFVLLLHPQAAQLSVCICNCLCSLALVFWIALLGLPNPIGLLRLTEAILGPPIRGQAGVYLMLPGTHGLLLARLPREGRCLLVHFDFCLVLALRLAMLVPLIVWEPAP